MCEICKCAGAILEEVHSAIGELDPSGEDQGISKAMYLVSVAKEHPNARAPELLELADEEYRKDTGRSLVDWEGDG